jgi:hypothetical protein
VRVVRKTVQQEDVDTRLRQFARDHGCYKTSETSENLDVVSIYAIESRLIIVMF